MILYRYCVISKSMKVYGTEENLPIGGRALTQFNINTCLDTLSLSKVIKSRRRLWSASLINRLATPQIIQASKWKSLDVLKSDLYDLRSGACQMHCLDHITAEVFIEEHKFHHGWLHNSLSVNFGNAFHQSRLTQRHCSLHNSAIGKRIESVDFFRPDDTTHSL